MHLKFFFPENGYLVRMAQTRILAQIIKAGGKGHRLVRYTRTVSSVYLCLQKAKRLRMMLKNIRWHIGLKRDLNCSVKNKTLLGTES